MEISAGTTDLELAALWHWNDRQSWDQAVMVVRHSEIDFDDLMAFAHEEGAPSTDIEKLQIAARESN